MNLKTFLVSLSMVTATIFSPAYGASSRGAQSPEERRNEQVVRDFYDAAINKKDFAAAASFLGEKYIQHNPTAGDGHEGLKKFLEVLTTKLPHYKSRIVSVFVDGDFVILHVHNVREPNTRGFAIIDIFRLENGKIVEHWDVRQEVPDPATAANQNGMF